jgi:hypothetical protein
LKKEAKNKPNKEKDVSLLDIFAKSDLKGTHFLILFPFCVSIFYNLPKSPNM